MKKLILGISAIFLTAACSSGGNAPYIKAETASNIGYHDASVTENIRMVAYRGDDSNTAKAKDATLLRAAELTLKAQHPWFELLDPDKISDELNQDSARGILAMTAATYRECGTLICSEVARPQYIRQPAGQNQLENDETVLTILFIKFGEGEKPPSGNTYDAASLRRTLIDRQ